MLGVFQTGQSQASMLISILLNIALIIFTVVSIKIEGKKYLPIKVTLAVYFLISTISLMIQL